MNALTLNNAESVLQSSLQQAVLILFWTPFSPESQIFLNVLKKEESRFENISFYHANAEEVAPLAQYFGIEQLPSLKLIQSAQLINEADGVLSLAELRVFLSDFVKETRDFHAEIQAAILSQNLKEALDLAEMALSHHPKDETFLLDLAEIHLNEKNGEEAEKILNGDFAEEVSRKESLLKRLHSLQNAPDVEPLKKEVEEHPEDLSLRLKLAQALFENAAFEEALDCALFVLREDKNFEEKKAQTMLLEFFKGLEGAQFDDLLRQKRRQMSRILN